jgi:hypothetical protein
MADHSALNEKPRSRGGPPESDVVLSCFVRITAIVASIIVVAVIALGLACFIENWLGMWQLDYAGILSTVSPVQCAMGVLAFVIVFAFLWRNLREAVKAAGVHRGAVRPWGFASDSRTDAIAEAVIKFLASDPVAP